MRSIRDITEVVEHRPWPIPKGRWRYYQEWNNALFLHWKVDALQLADLVPKDFPIDEFEGDAYISLVVFKMEKIRPRGLPAISLVSNFDEVNVRTYIIRDGKPGVYFISMEGARHLSVALSKFISGLPYYKSAMSLHNADENRHYTVSNKDKGSQLQVSFIVKEDKIKTALDHWLTERYCLYFLKKSIPYRYDIHHEPWKLKEVEMLSITNNYSFGKLSLKEKPELIQYADGVKVLAWKKQQLKHLP